MVNYTKMSQVLPKGKQKYMALFKMASYSDIPSARLIPSTSSLTIWDQSKYIHPSAIYACVS
jgi:hypothetical protein